METKICTFCGEGKPATKEYFHSNGSRGLYPRCKVCKQRDNKKNNYKHKTKRNGYSRNYAKEHRAEISQYSRDRYWENPEVGISRSAEYRKKNKDKINRNARERNKTPERKEYLRTYKLANKDVLYFKNKQYRETHKAQIRARDNKRNKTDINHRMKNTLSARIRSALNCQGVKKNSKTMDLLGCTIPEFKAHIENKFQKGMTWENHGVHGWHIDHIVPCAAYNLRDPIEQKQCFHYLNLQPLWAKDNIKKNSIVNGVKY